MEKTWETFWTTGKVTDYLTYRNEVTDVAGTFDECRICFGHAAAPSGQ